MQRGAFHRVVVAATAWAVGAGVAAATADWEPVLTPYLEIHAALVADKVEAIKADAAALAQAAAALGEPGTAVAAAARALGEAPDLKAARAAFMDLSEAIVKAAGDALPPDVRVAYCPMVKKPWLQKGDAIQNPYFGTEMPTCGYFKKR